MEDQDDTNDLSENIDRQDANYVENDSPDLKVPMSDLSQQISQTMSKHLGEMMAKIEVAMPKIEIAMPKIEVAMPKTTMALLGQLSNEIIAPKINPTIFSQHYLGMSGIINTSFGEPLGVGLMDQFVALSKIQFPTLGNLMVDIFPPIYHELREKLELLQDYHEETFLPVYRIGAANDLSEDALVKTVISNKSKIFEFSKSTSELIESKQDPLADAFLETIRAAESGFLIPAQAAAGNLLSFIRDHRLNKIGNLLNKQAIDSSKTLNELKEFFDFVENNYDNGDISLLGIFLYIYQHTTTLAEKPHDPAKITNRNASVHSSIHYYSEYNTLAFILYLSEVFQLIYRIQVNDKSIVKDLSSWTA